MRPEPICKPWRCCEDKIGAASEIGFGPGDHLLRHAGLGSDVVYGMVDDQVVAIEPVQGRGERGIGPQPFRLQAGRRPGHDQAQTQQQAVQGANGAKALKRNDQRAENPDGLRHAPWRGQRLAQLAPGPAEVPRRRRGRTKSLRLDVEHGVSAASQFRGDVLLVGPERIVPVRRGHQQDGGRRRGVAHDRIGRPAGQRSTISSYQSSRRAVWVRTSN